MFKNAPPREYNKNNKLTTSTTNNILLFFLNKMLTLARHYCRDKACLVRWHQCNFSDKARLVPTF